jgi:hypothetical protein
MKSIQAKHFPLDSTNDDACGYIFSHIAMRLEGAMSLSFCLSFWAFPWFAAISCVSKKHLDANAIFWNFSS